MLGLLGLVIAIEEERLVKSILALLCVWALLLAILFLRAGFLFFVGLRFGVFVGGLRVLRLGNGFIVRLRAVPIVADDFVLVAKGLLLRLQQLQVGRGCLRNFVVVFDLKLVWHRYILFWIIKQDKQ
jgi:hypothetical protein